MKFDLGFIEETIQPPSGKKHPKCLGERDYWGDFDCGYQTTLMCEDCKYGLGTRNPEAKCNQI